MSTDHKPELPSEKRRIYNAGSTISAEGRVDGGINLSRGFGDLRYKQNSKLGPHEQAVTVLPEIT